MTTSKTEGSMRDIQMNQMVYDALAALRRAATEDSVYVFGNRAGKPIDNKNFITRIWNPLLPRLRIGPATPLPDAPHRCHSVARCGRVARVDRAPARPHQHRDALSGVFATCPTTPPPRPAQPSSSCCASTWSCPRSGTVWRVPQRWRTKGTDDAGRTSIWGARCTRSSRIRASTSAACCAPPTRQAVRRRGVPLRLLRLRSQATGRVRECEAIL